MWFSSLPELSLESTDEEAFGMRSEIAAVCSFPEAGEDDDESMILPSAVGLDVCDENSGDELSTLDDAAFGVAAEFGKVDCDEGTAVGNANCEAPELR